MEEKKVPLHPAQKDIFLDQVINIDRPHYNVGGYIKLKGVVDKSHLAATVNSIPAVFDAFRQRFDIDDEDPVCYWYENCPPLTFDELDFSSHADAEQYARTWMKQQFNTPFVIKKPNPLFQLSLLKVAEDEYWFFNKYHHLITDGYGFAVWAQYVANKYRSLITGERIEFSFPSYLDAAIKSAAYYDSDGYHAERKYWQEKIRLKPPGILHSRYKFDRERPGKSGTYSSHLNESQIYTVEQAQKLMGTSLQQLTIAALTVFFAKTSDQSEFVFGIPIHKRRSRALRNTVGMFSGILPFKAIYTPTTDVRDFVRQIAATQKSDYRHQEFLIGDLNRSFKNYANDSIPDVVINYERLDFSLDFGEYLRADTYELTSEYSKYPLQLWWRDYGKQQPLELCMDFQYEYFSREEIELLADRIIYILEQFQRDPYINLDRIDGIPSQEKNRLLFDFNNTHVSYPKDKTLVDLLEAQALKTPDAIAVVFEREILTYKTLHEKSNQLGRYLQRHGVQEGALVPFCIERGTEMIVGILGILKAGGAYVPIDPTYPPDRIGYMVQHAGAGIVLSNTTCMGPLISSVTGKLILLDEEEGNITLESTARVNALLSPHHLAYVIYTSGSTGRPKGVMIEHRGVVNRLVWAQQYYQLQEKDHVLQKTSFSFDVSVWELLWPLMVGSRLVFSKPEGHRDHEYLKEIIKKEGITILHFVPSMLEVFLGEITPGECNSLFKVLCSGEELKPGCVRLFKEKLPSVQLHNLYGPTEASIDVTYWPVPEGAITGDIIPIGQPIANTEVYILDSERKLLPIGVSGELFIGGDGLARGYLNAPELTAEKFIRHPFSTAAGARLYRTGDLASWLPDGNIIYLGRTDDQIKIRGYRIELGEIEKVLESCPGVQTALVIVKDISPGNKCLIGYVMPDGVFDKEMIGHYLRTKLPEYMVPQLLVELDEVPLTVNGKADRKSLPGIDISQLLTGAYTAPRNRTEQILAGIWQEVLHVEKIGIHDNFFQLGGHSLLATRVISAIRKRLEVELTMRSLFIYPTIELLSIHLQRQVKGLSLPGLEQQERPVRIPLSFSQERLWFIDQLEGSVAYHIPQVLRLKGGLDVEALEYALRSLVNRHEVLRTVIRAEEGRAYQEVLPPDRWRLDILEREEAVEEQIAALLGKPFDLPTDHMLKGYLIGVAGDEHILVLVLH
ncbi:MAG TPA: amino acid adenylation domain-containing protein, partial [Puia sp.]|nr:amino acid adenylation domain-containing protein [Puia sp.]